MIQKAFCETEIFNPKDLKEEYVSNGYFIVKNLFTREECEEILQETTKMTFNEKNLVTIVQPHHNNELIQKYMKHKKLQNILGNVVGAHLPYWDGSVKGIQSMIFFKPPGTQGQAWHQDELCNNLFSNSLDLPSRDRSLIGCWIALDKATIENGCLWVAPESHRYGETYPIRPHNNSKEYEYEDESFGFEMSKVKPVELEIGDAVFFNGYLCHKSLPNKSQTSRKAIVFHYMNGYSLFPFYLKKDEKRIYVGDTDVREIIPVNGRDPYEYKGYSKESSFHWRILENGKVVKINPKKQEN